VWGWWTRGGFENKRGLIKGIRDPSTEAQSHPIRIYFGSSVRDRKCIYLSAPSRHLTSIDIAMAYVSVAELNTAYTLSGPKAANPMVAGSTILAHGTFDSGEETGPALFVVLRTLSRGTYLLAPLGAVDEYWGNHLAKSPQIKAKILQTPKESVPPDMELIRRWRVLAEPGAATKKEDFALLGKGGAEQALKTWRFLQDLVVSDKEVPQERQRPYP
jgi:hypothetical protein